MLFYSVNIIAILTLTHALFVSSEESTQSPYTTGSDDDTTLAPPLPSSVEKLVRFRRQPPVTIIKHYIRTSKRPKQRRRVKRPIIKYSKPSYVEHTYFKPKSPVKHSEPPSFTYDDIKHFTFDSSEFDLPPSSYESHAMDLDFYSHGDAVYDSPKGSKIEYSIESKPYYSHASNDEILTHEPHQSYGVPIKQVYNSDNQNSIPSNYYSDKDQHSSFVSHTDYNTKDNSADGHVYETYEAPPAHTSPYGNIYKSHPADSYGPPATHTTINKHPAKYGDTHSPAIAYSPALSKHPHSYNNQGNYKIYEKKIPNFGYHSTHNFAEPPPKNKNNIDISYSSSYEINLPPTKHMQGDFAEPPAYRPEHHPVHDAPVQPESPHTIYHAPEHPTQHYSETSNSHWYPQDNYGADLPINSDHKQPTYNFPKTSYEVPLYEPIPFDSTYNEHRENYPPNSYDNLNNHQGSESRDEHTYSIHQNTENDEQENDATENVEQSSTSLSESTTIQNHHELRPRVKRKRIRDSSHRAPVMHILDVPELEKAFEAGVRNKNIYYNSGDAETNESSPVHKKQNYISSTLRSTVATKSNDATNTWNPMRIRSYSRILAPTTTQTAPSTSTSNAGRGQKHHYYRSPSTVTLVTTATSLGQPKSTPDNLKNLAILSIEKSRSHSYYDGTLPPPTSEVMSSIKGTRSTRFKMPTKNLAAHIGQESLSKRTTKSLFDTTYFKSPRNDREVTVKQFMFKENLPTNHKLF